jgi:hypothetical protein
MNPKWYYVQCGFRIKISILLEHLQNNLKEGAISASERAATGLGSQGHSSVQAKHQGPQYSGLALLYATPGSHKRMPNAHQEVGLNLVPPGLVLHGPATKDHTAEAIGQSALCMTPHPLLCSCRSLRTFQCQDNCIHTEPKTHFTLHCPEVQHADFGQKIPGLSLHICSHRLWTHSIWHLSCNLSYCI